MSVSFPVTLPKMDGVIMRVTIHDVAQRAGVSNNTVSRVLNNRPDVSPATRTRIQQVIEELGYRPNSLARSLLRRESLTIGLVVTDCTNPNTARQIRAVQQTMAEGGYAVLIFDTQEDARRQEAALRVMEEKVVDGIIVTPATIQDDEIARLAQRLPVILLNREIDGLDTCDAVLNDNLEGARAAVAHLVANGHTRIGYVTATRNVSTVRDHCVGIMRRSRMRASPSIPCWSNAVQSRSKRRRRRRCGCWPREPHRRRFSPTTTSWRLASSPPCWMRTGACRTMSPSSGMTNRLRPLPEGPADNGCAADAGDGCRRGPVAHGATGGERGSVATRRAHAPPRRPRIVWGAAMTAAAPPLVAKQYRQTVGQFFERHIAYVLILPTLLGIAIVNLYPVGYAFVLSLQEKKLSTRATTFIGFANYRRILTDREVWNSIRLSLIFTVVSVGLSFAIGLALALLLNRPLRGRGLIRSLFIIPWAVPAFVAALTWSWMFNDQFGIFSALLKRVGVSDPPVSAGPEPRALVTDRRHDVEEFSLPDGRAARRLAGDPARTVRSGGSGRRIALAPVPRHHPAPTTPGRDGLGAPRLHQCVPLLRHPVDIDARRAVQRDESDRDRGLLDRLRLRGSRLWFGGGDGDVRLHPRGQRTLPLVLFPIGAGRMSTMPRMDARGTRTGAARTGVIGAYLISRSFSSSRCSPFSGCCGRPSHRAPPPSRCTPASCRQRSPRITSGG